MENGKMEKNMDKELLYIEILLDMKEVLKMAINMVMVL